MHSDLLAEGVELGLSGHEVARRSVDSVRRRLLQYGPDSLNDLELLSLVSGITEEVVLRQLAGSGLKGLFQTPIDALAATPMVGLPAAARLHAALALSRRLMTQPDPRPRLKTPAALYDFIRPHFLGLRHEEVQVLCLSARHQVLHHSRVACGFSDQCAVDPREVLAPAVAARAAGLVLVHNHPSGDPEPSTFDVALTRQLAEGAQLLGVKLLDHLVVTDRSFVSLLDRGLIDAPRSPPLARLSAPTHALTPAGAR